MKTTNKSLFSFTIFLAILGCFTSTQTTKVQAQVITPDNTLGNENSVVNTVGNRDTINGGALRGANLFHSFQEFGISGGREAYFANPAGIQNILTRVTGGNPSNILGTLGVLGNANLFLINPKGIQFGPNARLDVGGSFFASTADSLVFGNGFEFSASNTLAPPLLTVNTPIGLRFRDNPGNITNQSVVLDNTNFAVGLQVKPGNSLALVGGDVIVEQGGRLTAAGGRIELGGLAGAGTVGLDVTGNTFKLNFPANILLSNVSLTDDARVAVRGNGGGDIAVNANIFTATNGGRLVGGIDGIATKKGGDITVNSTNASFDGVGRSGFSSGIFSDVVENAVGNTGSINLTTRTLSLKNGAQIRASTFGRGNAGTVKIQANDISFDGVGNAGFSSGIFSNVEGNAVGDAGGVDITTGILSLTNGGAIFASTFSRGNAGSVKIQASDISFDGVENTGFSSGIFSFVFENALGKAGGIEISTRNLFLRNGAVINASTLGKGDGGNIKIQATDTIFASGIGSNFVPSSIRSNVEQNAIGNAGDINISTQNLSFRDGARITASTLGRGNAGTVRIQAGDISFDGVGSTGFSSGIFNAVFENGLGNAGGIDISTGKLSLTNGAVIDASTFGIGDAGRVKIKASDTIFASGIGSNFVPSSIRSNVQEKATGNAGGIDISTQNLSFRDGARITASTLGSGNAGTVRIQAGDISFDGVGSDGFSSGIFSSVEGSAVGNAGGIDIITEKLSLTNGAIINASTFALGDAGRIKILATDKVFADGFGNNGFSSGIFNAVFENGLGDAGGIDISTGKLSLTNGAVINARTSGRGNAGTVKITAPDISFDGVGSNGLSSGVFSSVEGSAVGNAGGIDIITEKLSLTNGAVINASTFGVGNAGTVKIQASDTIFASGIGSNEVSSSIISNVETNAIGNAGNIDISTGKLSLNNALISSRTFGKGNAGNILLRANDAITLAKSSYITTNVMPGSEGNGGNIDISGRSLTLIDGSRIQVAFFRQVEDIPGDIGMGGNIKINISDFINISGVEISSPELRSGIFASSEKGSSSPAGAININTNVFRIADDGLVTAQTANNDNGGNIVINAKTFEATSGGQVTTAALDRGNAGNITLKVVDRIELSGTGVTNPERESGIFANTVRGSTGNGGNIFIDPKIMVIRDNAGITASSLGIGNAGSVTVIADSLVLDNQGFIVTESSNGQGGKITITANDLLLLRRNSLISTNAGDGGGPGSGGDININTGVLVAFPQENSDITGNSFGGRGSNINIRTTGVFGIKIRPQLTDQSDITAFSEKSPQLSGQVTLTTPEVNPSQALVELPENLTNRTDQVARNPCQEGIGNEYIETGRGGLPTNPNQPLGSGVVRVDLVNLASNTGNTTASNTSNSNNSIEKKIIPAQGWVRNAKGQIVLTTYDPTGTSVQRIPNKTPVCHAR
ncbi:MAG: filamentous hemagglutinin N-terminal domain-containing protein [Scytonematopsis contorta HA4267-MV1]|jgi:filamentous hemagglutinin family protein|nr:filamentous hemagglutinin N-terminal domain-containing protein [Scytonematopsis contorta HA4267-MV1]